MIDALNVRQKVDDKKYGAEFDRIFRKGKDKSPAKGRRSSGKPTSDDPVIARQEHTLDIVNALAGSFNLDKITAVSVHDAWWFDRQVDVRGWYKVLDFPTTHDTVIVVGSAQQAVLRYSGMDRYRIGFPMEPEIQRGIAVEIRDHLARVAVVENAHDTVHHTFCLVYHDNRVAFNTVIFRNTKGKV